MQTFYVHKDFVLLLSLKCLFKIVEAIYLVEAISHLKLSKFKSDSSYVTN